MLRTSCWTTTLLALAGTPLLSAGDQPDGRELFERVWTAGDSRSHGGDGLGPVFNARSCVACHDQGGHGGGGSLEHNVTILSATMPPLPVLAEIDPATPQKESDVVRSEHAKAVAAVKEGRRKSRGLLVDGFHPEFAKVDSIVLHTHGTDEKAHAEWRKRTRVPGLVDGTASFILTDDVSFDFGGPIPAGGFIHQFGANPQSFPVLTEIQNGLNGIKAKRNASHDSATVIEGGASIRTSQRNTTALWGAGLVDRIPSEAIEAIAARQRESKGRVSGRPSRLGDGRIGRFGWKGQKASLRDFTVAACANELGLEVPGAHQATVAYDPEHRSKGLDLNEAELDALVEHIAALPAPVAKEEQGTVAKGRELFTSIGCAACHVEQVGEVVGLYSDLLLHDMGADLGAVGSYGVPSTPEPDPEDVPIASAEEKAKPAPPTSREWRTAPLWGVASSAPYLHDGRAKTIEQAIAFHGGEAAESRLRWALSKPEEQQALAAFLGSLVAPEVVARD